MCKLGAQNLNIFCTKYFYVFILLTQCNCFFFNYNFLNINAVNNILLFYRDIAILGAHFSIFFHPYYMLLYAKWQLKKKV